MARTKEFDRDVVLRRAVAAFREGGFEGTSIQTLVDRMGIHRASLYDTYGSKEQLFREVLAAYARQVQELYDAILTLDAPAREVLEQFFQRVVQELTDPAGHHTSCLMLKTALSGARHLAGIPELVRQYYGWFEGHFVRLVARGRREGSISCRATDAELAAALRHTLYGVIAGAAVDGSADALWRVVRRDLDSALRD